MKQQTTKDQFNRLLTPNLQAKSKPVLQLTAKPLPTLKLTAFPSRPVKGASNIRLASRGSKNA